MSETRPLGSRATAIKDGEPQGHVSRVSAQHHFWASDLVLGSNGRVRHVGHGSRGSYYLHDDVLHVTWDDFVPDLFIERSGIFKSIQLIEQPLRTLREKQDADVQGSTLEIASVALRLPGTKKVVDVRLGSSDVDVFGAVFLAREYAQPHLDGVRTILDLGANAGFASIFYAERYPEARIIAVEPDEANIQALRRNAQGWPRIVPVHAAVWHEDATLHLRTIDEAGNKLQDWAFQTRIDAFADDRSVQAMSIPTLMRRFGLKFLDLLKVDIEGAEEELFSYASEHWLAVTRCVVVETHDRFKAGSNAAVSERLSKDFDELRPSGENRIFVRRMFDASR